MAYSYSPIDKSEIRLFKGWLDGNGSIHGQLESFSIGTRSTGPYLPDYQAVSYAWGSGETTHHAEIDGLMLSILDSVYAFLQQMFSEHQGGWWWIDSICINQEDEKERASQITLMNDIFANADETRAWLGEASEGSALAMSFLQWMSTEPYNRKFEDSVNEAIAAVDGQYAREWTATNQLLKRSWWTRVWTVQEFAVAYELRVHCGASSISRHDLQMALSAIYDLGIYLDTTAQWNRSRIYDYYSVFHAENSLDIGMSLIATLAYLGDHYATDPRDRVYSLSGIVMDFDLAGHPNYEQSVEVLYTRIVKAFIEKYQKLDVICLATVFDGSDVSDDEALPSWVPDWRTSVTPLVVPVMVSQRVGGAIGNFRPGISAACTAAYRAASRSLPKAFLSSDLRRLHCCGFVFDTIDGLAGLKETTWGTSTSPAYAPELSTAGVHKNAGATQNLDDIAPHPHPASLLTAIMRCLILNRQDHYLGDYLTQKYDYVSQFQKLLLLAEGTSDVQDDWTTFRDWYTTNADFCIQGWTMHALRRQIQIALAEVYLPNKRRRKSFYSRFHDTTVKMSRRLVTLRNGGLGTAPRRAQKGDLVCILFGCSVPVVLRETSESGTFSFVGECYVDGFMEGEAMSSPAAADHRMFNII